MFRIIKQKSFIDLCNYSMTAIDAKQLTLLINISKISILLSIIENHDLFYFMQGKSHHFPDQLQQLTHKATKRLSDKYKFEDEALTSMIQQRQTSNDIQQAFLKSKNQEQPLNSKEKMNLKLKIIRTMLGYDNKKDKPKSVYKTINHSENEIKTNKGMNLKQFVLSMRKKSQLVDKCFDHQRSQSIEFNNIEQENTSIQEYGEASLKYIHSFIPHQTQVDNNQFKKARRINYSVNESPQRQQTEHWPNIQKPPYTNELKSSKTISPQMHKIPSDKSVKINLNVPKKCNVDNYNLINSTTPLKIYVNQLGALYHGKNYNRDLQKRMRKFKSQDQVPGNLNQKEHQKEFLPIIKHYFPVSKKQKSYGSHIDFH